SSFIVVVNTCNLWPSLSISSLTRCFIHGTLAALMKALDQFHPAVRDWFLKQFPAPTEPQAESWPAIKQGLHTLIAAPTGSGKTLAAFLSAIDDLVWIVAAGNLSDVQHGV